MRRLRQFRLRLRGEDRGVAVMTVVGLAAVMLILVTTALSYSVGGMTKSPPRALMLL